MTREEFIKQRCEIDKITEEEFERTYRVVDCNCGKIYCKGFRCLDLDDLLKENQELKQKYLNAVADYETTMSEKNKLKKQLETYEIEGYKQDEELNKISFDIRKYKIQQKEFIKYLEDNIYNIEPKGTSINYNCEYDSEERYISAMEEHSRLKTLKEILQKYKEIIGVLNEKES